MSGHSGECLGGCCPSHVESTCCAEISQVQLLGNGNAKRQHRLAVHRDVNCFPVAMHVYKMSEMQGTSGNIIVHSCYFVVCSLFNMQQHERHNLTIA